MTYLGSGIWSYSRLTAGAILSVTVPDTTIRSACRGPGANEITPSRMKSCRLIEVAMNSMAQHASPKLKTHRLYRRPQFRTTRSGSGASLAHGPIVGMPSSVDVDGADTTGAGEVAGSSGTGAVIANAAHPCAR